MKRLIGVIERRGALSLVAVCVAIGLGGFAVNALGSRETLDSFAKAKHFPVGAGPDSVAIGDFNGDHKRDLVVANFYGHDVSVLLGRGNGTFGRRRNFGAGTGATSVAIGDFNGDGKRDVGVANSGDGNVSVLLGRGNGTFRAPRYFGTNFGAQALAIGDFNGDGNPDLAVTGSYLMSNRVSILLGNGDGTFAAPTDFPVGVRPTAIAVGDFNGDGSPDLAVANLIGHTVSVLLGNGDGTFGARQNYPAGTNPSAVAVGDLNGDGNPDLAVTDLISPIAEGPKNQMLPGHVSVLLGKGDGTFGTTTEFPVNRGRSPHPGTSSSAVVIGDVTGDSKPDLLVTLTTASSAGQLAILRGKGNGSFAAPLSVPVGTQPVCSVAERRTGHCPRAAVAIGRLNADDRPDLVVANFGTNRVSVLLKR